MRGRAFSRRSFLAAASLTLAGCAPAAAQTPNRLVLPLAPRDARPEGGPVWVARARLPFARAAARLVAAPDGALYLLGGFGPDYGGYRLNADAYDPATDAWTALPDLLSPRADHGAGVGGDGRVYVFGGTKDYGPQNFLATAEAYDPALRRWVAVASMSRPRWACAGVAGPDRRLYAFGGQGSTPGGSFANTTATGEVFDPTTSRWTPTAPMSVPRQGATAVAAPDGRLYVFGGANWVGETDPGSFTQWASVEAYDPRADRWGPVTDMPTPRRGFGAALGPDGLIYVVGGAEGYTGSRLVETFDPASGRWGTTASLPQGRDSPAVAAGGEGRLYAMGGYAGGHADSNDAYAP